VLDVAQGDLPAAGVEHVEGEQLGGLDHAHGTDRRCWGCRRTRRCVWRQCHDHARATSGSGDHATCDVTPNTLWRRFSDFSTSINSRASLDSAYANRYANQPDSGGVRGRTPTYVKRSGPAETRHPRTPTDPLPESGGQVVAGSNPVSPTKFRQVKCYV
jgi:hypothetical protein